MNPKLNNVGILALHVVEYRVTRKHCEEITPSQEEKVYNSF